MGFTGGCSVPGCNGNHNARGLCGKHYMAAKRTGLLPKKRDLKDRLEKLSVLNEKTGCIEWISSKWDGYGLVWYGNGNIRAHRAAWIVAHGEIPAGKAVLHKCDNPSCINIAHLFLGTHADNSDDKVTKGRQARGESSGRAKLSERDVVDIRKNTNASGASIARSYGISPETVYSIKKKRTWRHI